MEETKSTTLNPDANEAAACVHVWIIETMPGAASEGVCQKCGASKSFANWLAQTQWEDYGRESAREETPIRSLTDFRREKRPAGEWEDTPLADAS